MWDFIYNNLKKNILLFDDKKIYNYQALISTILIHGENLRKELQTKSKCAILCRSELNTALAILSCWYADMVPIPMSLNYGISSCNKIIETTNPDILITDDNSFDFYRFKYCLLDNSFLGKKNDVDTNKDLNDVALIMCTSGTTGMPKGVMITKNALIKNVILISEYFDIDYKDSILIARPLYHCAVLTGEFLISLYKGLNIAFFDEKYNPNKVLACAVENNISVLCGTPTLFNHMSMFAQRSQIKLPIKKIALSGECLNKNVAKNIRKGFPDAHIYNVYGLTEASPRVSFLSPDKFDLIPESVGVPLNGIRIVILDIYSKKELPSNSKGLIVIKTPCIMKGYYNNIEYTNKAIKNDWLLTGDVGYKDNEGNLFILSRQDDMIIKGGMNIYPREIENEIEALYEIEECLVYGETSIQGQSISVDIVLKDEYKNLSEIELMKRFVEILPEYQIPTRVRIVSEINRNASGKKVRPRNFRK